MLSFLHQEISLHPRGVVSDTTLECYCCGIKNIFLLGFVPAQTDSVVVLMCRQPCSLKSSTKELSWNPEQWLPLISGHSILEWLVKRPSSDEQLRMRQITNAQINVLEDLWKENPIASADDIRNQHTEDLKQVLLRYEDGYQYQNIFGPLIHAEEEYEKALKMTQVDAKVRVRFETGLNKKICAHFTLPSTDSG